MLVPVMGVTRSDIIQSFPFMHAQSFLDINPKPFFISSSGLHKHITLKLGPKEASSH